MNTRVNGVSGVYGAYAPEFTAAQPKKAKDPAQKDSATLSLQAKDFQTARLALAGVPDIREDAVSAVMNRIKKGDYNIRSIDIAEKILGSEMF